MKITIEVKDAEEARLIRAGLSNPVARAAIKVVGALMPLPSDRARRRVLGFASDHLAEQNESQK